MGTDESLRVSEVDPRNAWKILSTDAGAVLVDVRTAPELGFVGGPDLSELGKGVLHVEWKTWPDMSPHPDFVGALMEELSGLPTRLLFICRSGARSMQAALAAADALPARGVSAECTNVSEGFEGDLDARRQRGALNGWKAHGLDWRQS